MRGWRGNLLGSVVVLMLIGAISVGLPMVAEALPEHHAVSPDRRLYVGNGVDLLPPPGAAEDRAESSPHEGRLVLNVQGVRYAVIATPWMHDLARADRRLRDRIGQLRGYQLSGESHAVRTDGGVPGRAGRFTSPRRDGYFAVYVSGGVVVEVIAQGVGLHFGNRLALIQVSIATIQFRDAA